MLLQLQLAELLLLLLGLPVLLLALLLLLSFLPPRPLSFLPFPPPRVGWALSVLRVQAWRIGTGEVEALIAPSRFKNQPGPGPYCT
jgi:hypothetical protein